MIGNTHVLKNKSTFSSSTWNSCSAMWIPTRLINW